jgi:hypothetical protein
MIYNLDKKFINRTKINIISIGSIFILVGLASSYAAIVGKNWEFLVGVVLIYSGFNKYKELQRWRTDSNRMFLEINEDNVSVSDSIEMRSLKVKSITKIVLQPIHGKIKSIVLHSSNDNITKLQGFESMDLIATHFKQLIGDSKIKTAKWFHR